MFKSARWRSEKRKIKAVFRLQFHATGLAQVEGDSLVISLIPADVGKPTARLDKAIICDGSCYWERPVYESLKLFREPRTWKFCEKIYYFVVSNDWSRAGIVGEVSINLASYADSFKVSSVSLPLKIAKNDAVLHVSIQRVLEDDERETQETENANLTSIDGSLRAHLSNCDVDNNAKASCTPNSPLYDEIPITPESKRNNWASSGSDLTLPSSESNYGLDTPREFGLQYNLNNPGTTSILLATEPLPDSTLGSSTSLDAFHSGVATSVVPDNVATPIAINLPTGIHEEHRMSQVELISNPGPKARDVRCIEKSEEPSNLVISRLNAEISSLSRKVEVSDLELQTLRKLIVKESKKGQDLLREVTSLKEERDALKVECQKAKVKNKFEQGDPRTLIEELKQEVNFEKDLNSSLRVQLMKMQESNSELILAVRDLDKMLEQKDKEILNLSKSSDDEEKKLTDLCSELEMIRQDKEELEGQVEQLVLDYEILKQENHDLLYQLEQRQAQEQLKLQYECSYATTTELENLENELKKQSDKFSVALATIAGLEENLEKQAQGFEADLGILSNANVQLEKRAIRAEEALRKMRWQNANTAGRIHDEFRRISVEMTSTLESNGKFIEKALNEGNELRMQKSHLEDLLKRSKEELHSMTEQYEEKIKRLSSELTLKVNEIEQLEQEKTHGEQRNTVLSEEILMLRAEIEMLKGEKDSVLVEVEEKHNLKRELERTNSSMREMEMVLEGETLEKIKMEIEIVLLQEKAEISADELRSLSKAKDDNQAMIENMHLQLETLQCQHDEVKHLLSADALERENLKDKIKFLEGQIKLKEAEFENSTSSYLEKEKDLQGEVEKLERRLEYLSQNSGNCSECELKKVDRDVNAISSGGTSNIAAESLSKMACENIKSEILHKNSIDPSGSSVGDKVGTDEALRAIALLKERNELMEFELKEMQERYSEMSLKLAQVEGERQQLMMRVRNLKNARRS